MKRKFLLSILSVLFLGNMAMTQCQAFMQYTLGLCPQVMFFDGSTSSGGSVVAWQWDFGDGNSSNFQNPTNTYSANGTYLVCLSILTSDSCTSTYCDTISINCIASSSCNANFGYTVGACPNIIFVDNSTSSPGSIVSWSWDFGDGSTSTVQNPSHTYMADGSYLTCLTITTDDSCTSTFCDTVTINCIGGVNCNAYFTYSDSCPTFCFSDNSTHTGTITGWNWDFGDGNTANTNGPCHTYATDGSYVVCYSITTSDSCSSTVCDTIVVNCTVGINDLDDNSIQMYPNPVSDELTLSLDPRMPVQAIDLRDSRGRLVNAINPALFNNGVYTINVNELPSGLYFITLHNGQATKAYRFVKQ